MSRQDLRPSQTLKWKQFFILLMDPSGGSWLADSFLVTKIINKLTERKYRVGTWITCLVNPYSFLWKQKVGWFVLQVWEVIPECFYDQYQLRLPPQSDRQQAETSEPRRGDIGGVSCGQPGPGQLHSQNTTQLPAATWSLQLHKYQNWWCITKYRLQSHKNILGSVGYFC